MSAANQRPLSMRPAVDRMLAEHVERAGSATRSSTVNPGLLDDLEAAALAAYHQWDLDADVHERGALVALDAHDDGSWATG